MKRYLIFVLVIMSALSVIRLNAQDVTFQVSAPPAVAAGMQFQIAYSINVARAAEFRLPPEFSEVFDIRFGPTQSTASSMQIANGRQTRTESTTFTTVVIAKNEGTHTLGPATVRVGNSEYKSNSLTINVLPPDQTAQVQQQGGGGAQQQGGRTADASSGISAESLFMRMIVSNRDVYEQEGFLVTFKLYYLVDIGTIAPRFPDFDGFFAQDIDLNDDQRGTIENYNGRNYRTYILRQTILYPQRSGSITIGSGKVETEVRVRNQSRGSSFFDDFFSSYRTVKHEVESQPATINVKPLPSGKPASFTGAVGNYTMTSEINRTELKANEAVTIKLTIRGNGNIRLLRNPEVRFPNDFEIFDPVQNNNIRVTTTGVSGSRTIEYTAIPRFAGEFEIPGVNFSFFNPQTGRYETQTTEAYRLTVERDESSSDAPPVISTFTNRESVRFLGQDIRYLKTQRIHFIPQHKEIFFGSFLYVMAYLIIAILSVVFFIIYRKQVKENSNLALVRTKKANKTAVKRLKQAEKLLKENKEEAFYEEVLRTLWGYLSDKLNIPQSELAKDNVAMELTKYGVDEVLTGEFLEIIHTCEFARYAPSKTSAAMDNTFRVTIDAISKMENTLKK